jgi:hypothetical protein
MYDSQLLIALLLAISCIRPFAELAAFLIRREKLTNSPEVQDKIEECM